MRNLLIWGVGGQAAVIADIARFAGWTVIGFVNDRSNGASAAVSKEAPVYDGSSAEDLVRRGVRHAAVAIGDPRGRLEKAALLEAWATRCRLSCIRARWWRTPHRWWPARSCAPEPSSRLWPASAASP